MLIQEPPVEIAPGIWMLGTTAYPVYLVRGQQEALLIEGGISAIASILGRQFKDLQVGPDVLRQAVVTHAHPDHVMAIPRLRTAFPGIRVLASAPAAAVLGSDKALAFFRQMDTLFTGTLVQHGVPVAEADTATAQDDFAVDQTVREGDQVVVEASTWTVLETPGHSDCSISLYNQAEGVLMISDASGYYMPAAGTWWPNYFTGYAAYVHSLERLAGLNAKVLCLSHNGVVQGVDAIHSYFAGAIATTEQYHQRILAETQAGKTPREIAERLGQEIHAQLQTMSLDFFQKNCGVLVKQSLRVERNESGNAPQP